MLRDQATIVVRRLRDAGYEALFAGGCVRDRLLGLEPADYDVVTSARPPQVEALFEKTIPVGRRFGILIVQSGGFDFEVATYRSDGPYLDGRHPSSVRFASREEDALRRDFTINAMFEDPGTGEVIDLAGGRSDLAAGVIRAVGEPRRRFAEDRLRLIRAVRFAARFRFRIEEATFAAITEDSPHLADVAAERTGTEFAKILTEGGARLGFELLDATGLLGVLLPEMLELKGCEQSPDYHPEGDVFVHTLKCIEQLPASCTLTLALGLLLHDIAKPRCAGQRDGRRTFYGHSEMGAEMAREICHRLRYSGSTIERVAWLVAQHLRHTAASSMKPSTLKRFLRQDGIEELLELTRMDALASSGDLRHTDYCRAQLAALPDEALRPTRLISGDDLLAIGLTPGPQFKEILTAVEEAQLEGRIDSRDQALAFVRERCLAGPTR